MALDEPRGRVGTVVAGKWQIDERIGSGGMATVYAATHRNGMRAALKMLHPPLSRDASTRARFLREGYVANSVGHDGVVAVLDDGVTDDGSAFLVLELLEGETIDARRHRLGGSIPITEALDIGSQMLAALAAAHEKGIVHRDVKPENIFITTQNKVKILDFGLAHMRDAQGEVTKTGVTIGTPEFMPPEQAQGRRDKVDGRSDVWMVGATLFTIITGAFVHDDAETIHEALIASATRRPRPVRELTPHLSPAIANVIDRALELEMTDRWESAAHMRSALLAAQSQSARGQKLDSETHLAMPTTSRRQLPPSDDTMQDIPEADVGSGEVDLEATHYDHGHQAAQPSPRLQPTPTPRMSSRPYRNPLQTPSDEHLTHSGAPRSVPPSMRAGADQTGPRSVPPPSIRGVDQTGPRSVAPPSRPDAVTLAQSSSRGMSQPPSARSVPPPGLTPRSPGSMPPPSRQRQPSFHAIHDPLEPTPIFQAPRGPMGSIPPEGYAPEGYYPPPSMPPPSLPPPSMHRPQGQSPKETIALVALALFFLCAAMGVYMMRR